MLLSQQKKCIICGKSISVIINYVRSCNSCGSEIVLCKDCESEYQTNETKRCPLCGGKLGKLFHETHPGIMY